MSKTITIIKRTGDQLPIYNPPTKVGNDAYIHQSVTLDFRGYDVLESTPDKVVLVFTGARADNFSFVSDTLPSLDFSQGDLPGTSIFQSGKVIEKHFTYKGVPLHPLLAGPWVTGEIALITKEGVAPLSITHDHYIFDSSYPVEWRNAPAGGEFGVEDESITRL